MPSSLEMFLERKDISSKISKLSEDDKKRVYKLAEKYSINLPLNTLVSLGYISYAKLLAEKEKNIFRRGEFYATIKDKEGVEEIIKKISKDFPDVKSYYTAKLFLMLGDDESKKKAVNEIKNVTDLARKAELLCMLGEIDEINNLLKDLNSKDYEIYNPKYKDEIKNYFYVHLRDKEKIKSVSDPLERSHFFFQMGEINDAIASLKEVPPKQKLDSLFGYWLTRAGMTA